MGASSSCQIFERLSCALNWIATNKLHIANMVHILDDFFIIEKSNLSCLAALNRFQDICKYIGIPLSEEKTFDPSQILSFKGIELDSTKMEARMPVEKIVDCKATINKFMDRKKITLKVMQSLIGKLNFACSTIVPGRTFLRRCINMTIGIKKPYHYIKLNKQIKADLHAWLIFQEDFNGKTFFLSNIWDSSTSLHLFTDASGKLGYGAVFGTHWFYGLWPVAWQHKNIAFLELYPILAAFATWGPSLQNRKILIHTDNMAIVHVLNKATSKDNDIMCLLR